MARERVGLATWEEMPPSEQDKLITAQIWDATVYAAWIEERQAEEARRLAKLKKSSSGGSLKQLRRRKGASGDDDEGEDDY